MIKLSPLVWARDLRYCGPWNKRRASTHARSTCLVFQGIGWVQGSSTFSSDRTWSQTFLNDCSSNLWSVGFGESRERKLAYFCFRNLLFSLVFSQVVRKRYFWDLGTIFKLVIHWFKPKFIQFSCHFVWLESLSRARMVESKVLRSCLAGGEYLPQTRRRLVLYMNFNGIHVQALPSIFGPISYFTLKFKDDWDFILLFQNLSLIHKHKWSIEVVFPQNLYHFCSLQLRLFMFELQFSISSSRQQSASLRFQT